MATVSGGALLDQALKKIGDKIGKAREVRVGFLEGEASTYQTGMNVASVAAINNFGAPAAGIPARPFFTNMIAKQSPEWGEMFAKYLRLADYDTDKALGNMGGKISSQLSIAITEFTEVPNSPVTNLLKQRFPEGSGHYSFADVQKAREDVANGVTAPSGKPLIWSGNLLRNVGSEVE